MGARGATRVRGVTFAALVILALLVAAAGYSGQLTGSSVLKQPRVAPTSGIIDLEATWSSKKIPEDQMDSITIWYRVGELYGGPLHPTPDVAVPIGKDLRYWTLEAFLKRQIPYEKGIKAYITVKGPDGVHFICRIWINEFFGAKECANLGMVHCELK
jgi:hypothetical protein